MDTSPKKGKSTYFFRKFTSYKLKNNKDVNITEIIYNICLILVN